MVRSEALFQDAQESKRQASEAFERGEFETGQRLIGESHQRLEESLAVAPEDLKPGIRAELDEVSRMERYAEFEGASSANDLSKMTRESYHLGSRKRGRTVSFDLGDDESSDG